MASLYRREVEENELSSQAQNVLERVRHGMTETAAAESARVDPDELRQWKRDHGFRAALNRARRDGPVSPRVWL